jgi:hypothetical protein
VRYAANAKKVPAGPGIALKAFRNFPGGARAYDQKHIWRVFQRSAEDDETFLLKTVHEAGVRIPLGLLLQPERGIPSVAAGADDGDELYNFDPTPSI